MKTHVTLQERLKDLRVEKGLSQDDLADIEIYIDGIAGQNFQAIQAVMNAYHEKIVRSLKPDRDDIWAALLEANHVEERNYFINRINTELTPILDDIRDAHKKDSETATDTTLKDLILGNIQVSQIPDEDPDEYVAQIFFKSFCSTSGINPSTVPPEEYSIFKKLMHRSKKYKDMLKPKKNSRKVKRLKERKDKTSES